jgi:hypothetical protein
MYTTDNTSIVNCIHYLHKVVQFSLKTVPIEGAETCSRELIFCCLFLWLCSPARAMSCCGCAAQRGLWAPVALQPSAGYGLLVPRGFLITHNDAPQSVGFLWKSDQLVAETST